VSHTPDLKNQVIDEVSEEADQRIMSKANSKKSGKMG